MSKQRKASPLSLQALCEIYAEGGGVSDIKRRMFEASGQSYSSTFIYDRLREAGVVLRPSGRNFYKIKPSEHTKIVKRHNQGETLKNIAASFGVTETHIRGIVDRRTILQSANDLQTLSLSGDRLREFRLGMEYTQAEAAALIGLSNPDMVRRWEQGATPSAKWLIRLLLLYHVDHIRDVLESQHSEPKKGEI